MRARAALNSLQRREDVWHSLRVQTCGRHSLDSLAADVACAAAASVAKTQKEATSGVSAQLEHQSLQAGSDGWPGGPHLTVDGNLQILRPQLEEASHC